MKPSVNKYQMVEQDYNNLLPSVHDTYDATVEFKGAIELFTQKMPQNAFILNIGGAASECNYFLNSGFTVDDIDISQAMIDHIAEHSPKTNAIKGNITSYKVSRSYDGIWACRSLIHVPPADFPGVLKNIHALLGDDGCFGAVFFSTNLDHVVEEELPEEYATKEGLTYYRSLYPKEILLELYKRANLSPVHIEDVADLDGDEGWFILAQH